MKGNQKNQDNLDAIYSDFSDPEQQPQQPNPVPITKPPIPQPTITPPTTVSGIKMPTMHGGKVFFPPPPPSSKPIGKISIPEEILQVQGQVQGGRTHHPHPNTHIHNQPQNFPNPNHNNPHNHQQRQRKSTIFIKNIPKTCNKQQTLTTFFRTFGNIKSIKTNQDAHTANVRFQREQDAYRFMATKPLILNRSYIIYDTSEDFVVPVESIGEREKDQVVTINSTQKQLIILKQNTQTLIAQKYRALLFLHHQSHKLQTSQQQEILHQMHICKKIRQLDSNNQELGELLTNFQNQYDWTLVWRVVVKELVDKKKVISQFNKYGPIGTISVKIVSPAIQAPVPAPVPVFEAPVVTTPGQQASESAQDKEKDKQKQKDKIATIRLKFLGVRSSWLMYADHCTALGLQVQGRKLSDIFKAWFVKYQEDVQLMNQLMKLQEQQAQGQVQQGQQQPKQLQNAAEQANQAQEPVIAQIEKEKQQNQVLPETQSQAISSSKVQQEQQVQADKKAEEEGEAK